jgi:hypothetical protein
MVSQMLPGGEAGYGCKNREPRYRHNPAHWLGGNRHCYGTVLNCDRDKHYRLPGKSALNWRVELLMPSSRAQLCEPSEPSRQRSAVALLR